MPPFPQIVQHFSTQATGVATFLFSYPNGVQAGNQLAILVGTESSPLSPISFVDNQNNIWTLRQHYVGGSDTHGWSMYTAQAGASGALTMTVVFHDVTDCGAVGAELHGVALDQVLSNEGISSSWTSLPLTTTVPNELLIVFDVSYNSDAAPTDSFTVLEDMVLHLDGMALAALPAPSVGTFSSSWSAGASREWKLFLLSYAPLIAGKAYIPLPFSQRTTAAVATFACIGIASPAGAQRLASPTTRAALSAEYANLNSVYMILRRQDVPQQREILVAAVARALGIAQDLATTLNSMTATGDDAVTLARMQAVVAGAIIQVGHVQVDEQ